MEGISLPKFLLLNKMSFLVLLPIYPLYRQAEDYSDYRFSESIHWSLYWKNIWILFFVVWGQNSTVQSVFFPA